MDHRSFTKMLGLGMSSVGSLFCAKKALSSAAMEPSDAAKDQAAIAEADRIFRENAAQIKAERERCLQELKNYYKALKHASFVPRFPVSAVVPFGTLPMNYYVREPEGVGYTPDLTTLRRHVEEREMPYLLNSPVRKLTRDYMKDLMAEKLPESQMVPPNSIKRPTTEEIHLWRKQDTPMLLPSRYISPAFALNLDKAELNNCKLAWIILCGCHGLCADMCRGFDIAWACAAYHANYPNETPRIVMQHEPISVWVKKESYMLSFYFNIIAQGILLRPGMPDPINMVKV